ncbi:hypothetical protein ADL12_29875 [Streptomyces regalis]|uniref:MaoC-like domain-containing protein n=2 Tax=Streptomyces regalis TaxID=68262 RepID=A0A101JJ99_9ACTN|nr:hypothetical protein ADL12_29875 [Streptomyces regalis]
MTLALLPEVMRAVFDIEKIERGVNFGLDKVRFPRPIPVGARVRGAKPAGEVEVDGQPHSACVEGSFSHRVTTPTLARMSARALRPTYRTGSREERAVWTARCSSG